MKQFLFFVYPHFLPPESRVFVPAPQCVFCQSPETHTGSLLQEYSCKNDEKQENVNTSNYAQHCSKKLEERSFQSRERRKSTLT